MSYNQDLRFKNNITPLDANHLNALVDNIDFVYNAIKELIPTIGTSLTPLPTAGGDGIIRYVVPVSYDMIWIKDPSDSSESSSDSSEPPLDLDGSYFFVAVLDDSEQNRYHLEIWCRDEQGNWKENDDWATKIITETNLVIQYTNRAWEHCTHDKMYVCQNTNQCYYMLNKYGMGVSSSITPGTTDQSGVFMTSAMYAKHDEFTVDGSTLILEWL